MGEILFLFPVSAKYLFALFSQLKVCIRVELLKSRFDERSESIRTTSEQTVGN